MKGVIMTKKNLGVFQKIAFILSLIVTLVSFFLPIYVDKSTSTSGKPTEVMAWCTKSSFVALNLLTMLGLILIVACLIIGGILSYNEKKSIRYVGKGLVAVGFVVPLLEDLMFIVSSKENYVSIGFILLVVGVVLLVLSYVLDIIMFVVDEEECENDIDSRIEKIRFYKSVLDEGIISEEEYQQKKNEILNLHVSKGKPVQK